MIMIVLITSTSSAAVMVKKIYLEGECTKEKKGGIGFKNVKEAESTSDPFGAKSTGSSQLQ